MLTKSEQDILFETFKIKSICFELQSIYKTKESFYKAMGKLKDIGLIDSLNRIKEDKRRVIYVLTDEGKLFVSLYIKHFKIPLKDPDYILHIL